MTPPTEPGPRSASVNGDLVNRVQQLRLDTQPTRGARSGGGSWLPWVLCGLLTVSWVGVGIRWYRATPSSDVAPVAGGSAPAARAPAIGGRPSSGTGETSGDANFSGELLLNYQGILVPALQIAVSPDDISSRVVSINFTEGQWVNKDDTLATLWDARYQNEFASAEAARKAALARWTEAKLMRASVDTKIAEMKAFEWANKEELMMLDKARDRADAAGQLERVKVQATLSSYAARLQAAFADRDAADARIDSALSDLHAAEARQAEAARLLKNCVIKAPISGIILTKKADVGSLVSPAAFQVATSLCEIADTSKMEVEVDVPEREILKLIDKDGGIPRRYCEVVHEAAPDRPYRGYVDRVIPIADQGNHQIKVRVRVILPKEPKTDRLLRPKMAVSVFVYNRLFAYQPGDRDWDEDGGWLARQVHEIEMARGK